MRKKATYWGLGLCLALGLTATAASGLLPVPTFVSSAVQSFAMTAEEGDTGETDPYKEYRSPSSITPESGSEFGTDQKLSSIKLQFKRGVAVNRSCTDPIVIKRGDETVQSIAASNMAAVALDKIDFSVVNINFDPLTVAGKYTVSFPAKFFNPNNGSDEPIESEAFQVEYTIVQAFENTVVPAPGTELTQFDNTQQFVVSFEGIKSLKVNMDIAEPEVADNGARIVYTNGSKTSVATTVTVKADGNKLIITPDNTVTTLTTNTKTQNYQIVLPKGCLTFDDNIASPAYAWTYYLTAFPKGDLVINPLPSNDYLSTIYDLDTFTLDLAKFPGASVTTSSYYAKNGAKLCSYNPETGAVATTNVATFNVKMDEDGHTAIFTRNDPTTSTVVLNNPQLWDRGAYAIVINPNILLRGENNSIKNAAINFFPYYVPGQTNVNPASIVPADGTIINPDEGLEQVALQYTSAVMALDKNINIYKDGAETPILSFSATNTRYVTLSNSDKNVNIQFPAFKEKGTYVVEIPEGAFRQKSGAELTNAATKLNYTVPEPLKRSVVPAPGYIESLDAVTVTFDDATELTLKSEETIPLLGGTGATAQAGYTFTPSVEGNKLVLTLSKTQTAANAAPYYVDIPSGLVSMKVNGQEVVNPNYRLAYRIDNLPGGSIVPAPGKVDASQLKQFVYNAPEGYKVKSVSATTVKLCPIKADGNPDTSSAKLLAEYTGTANEDGTAVTFVDNGKYNVAAIPTGSYILRITNGVITFYKDGDEEMTDVKFKGPQDFTYEVEGIGLVNLELADVISQMEALPKSYTFKAPEGCKLGFFEGFEPTIYIQQGSNTTKGRIQLTPEFAENGDLVLSMTDEQYAQLEGLSGGLYGKKYAFYTKSAGQTSTVSGLTAGSIKITDKDGKVVSTNAGQAYEFTAEGPNSDPYKAIEPMPGPFKVAEHPAGINEITITTDSYMPIAINWECQENVLVFKDGVMVPMTLNVFAMEQPTPNSVKMYVTPAIEETGKYTFIFPRNMFKYGTLETPSIEFSIDYNVTGLDPIAAASVNPADGSVISQFDGINLAFDGIEIASVEKVGEIFYNVVDPLAMLPGMSVMNLVPVVNPDKKSILLTLSEEDEAILKEAGNWPIQNPGFYNINYGKNSILITDTEGKQYGLAEGSAQLELIPLVANTITPEGFFIELNDMTVAFDGVTAIEKYEFNTTDDKVTLTDAEGKDIPVTVTIEGNKLIAAPAAPITTVGTYTLNIPAKLYTLTRESGKIFNRAITHEFNVQAKPSIVKVYPANGSTILFLANVDITFSTKPVVNKNTEGEVVLSRDGEAIMKLGRKSNQIKIGWGDDPDELCQLCFYTEKIEIGGKYTVDIPEGFFLFDGIPSEAIHLEYTLLQTPDYTVVPAPDSAIESLPEVRITFDGVKEIKGEKVAPNSEDAGFPRIVSTSNEDEILRWESSEKACGEVIFDGGTIIFKTTNPANLADGTWELFIPEGAFTFVMDNGTEQKCPELRFDFYKSKYASPVINPTPGTVDVNAFAGNITVSLVDGNKFDMWLPSNAVVLKNSEGKEITRWLYDFQKDGSARGKDQVTLYNQYEGTEALKVPAGDYTLRIGKGTIMMQVDPYALDPDDENAGTSTTYVSPVAYVYYYTVVEGGNVTSIFDNASSFNIYTVDGKIVKINADQEFVNALEEGLYIINGRRVYIRK